ncbi:DUF2062 domain-containing protein [Endothiovibrio diazotrophicus]
MPKQLIKRFMPDRETIRNHKHLRIFGTLLHDPNLFHLNRRSVAGAFAVGLFNAFVPVPFQMVLAAAAAILFRVNLPISVALVWLTNPVTMPPVFYFAYRVGAWTLGRDVSGAFHFELSWEWLGGELAAIWQPFLLGCFICGAIAALAGYAAIRLAWRYHIVQRLKEKRQRIAERLHRHP